jgi:hypothetical protein
MKIIKNFKSFSISEADYSEMKISGDTKMVYRTFFVVPVRNDAYGYMEFELSPISTSMPDMEDSLYARRDDWIFSPGFGKIFIATFFSQLKYVSSIPPRDVDHEESIDDIVSDVKRIGETVSFYPIESDPEDEYGFILIEEMVRRTSVNLEEVLISVLGCKEHIQKKFTAELAKADFKLECTPQTISIIRKQVPELFDLMVSKFGEDIITLSDLGEFGF